MKRWIWLLAFCLLLIGCGSYVPDSATQAATTATAPDPTTEPVPPKASTESPTTETTEAIPEETTQEPTTEPPTEETTQETTDPPFDREEVITYFKEVCLDAEISHSGDASLLQRWEAPIYYSIEGEATEEDLSVLENFFLWLNQVPGFPGIYAAESLQQINLRIYFCLQSDFRTYMGPGFDDLDGAVTFWYDSSNVIYDATICYRTDLEQLVRNSVLLEEIYNCLGPIQDTQLREDSIIYAGYSTPQELTEMDMLILQLLYHPDLKCGMTTEQCEAILRWILA